MMSLFQTEKGQMHSMTFKTWCRKYDWVPNLITSFAALVGLVDAIYENNVDAALWTAMLLYVMLFIVLPRSLEARDVNPTHPPRRKKSVV